MKQVLVVLIFCALTWTAFGQGSQIIIRERAKELRNQNNVRQGVPPPVQPGPAAGQAQPANPPPPPSPTLQKLKTDLSAITANSQPSAEVKAKVAQDLQAVAQGSKPTPETAAKFAEQVSAALAEKPLSAMSMARFVQEIDALMNPAKYPQAKPDGIYADVQAIFQENGLKRTQAVALADVVKAAAAEVRSGH